MQKTMIKDILVKGSPSVGASVTVYGWVRTLRDSKGLVFIELNDGSCFANLQVVVEENKLSNFAEISHLNIGTSLGVTGELVASPGGKQSVELKATEITIVGASLPEFPLQKKHHTFEYLRTIAHLRPRTNTFNAVFRVRSLLSYAIHKFFQENDFVYVHAPIITGSDCEGAGEMFRITTFDLNNLPKDKDVKVIDSEDFFGKPTSLTVSGQLEAEAFAFGFGKVYTFGPTFRAENSTTKRHAAEFWMMEPEVAFADLNDNMDLAEAMIKYIVKYLLDNAKAELDFFNQFIDTGLLARLEQIVSSSFERITYTEAVEKLLAADAKFEYPVKWGIDLQTEHEKYLTDVVYKKPVFVTGYPKEIKAFYMRQNEDGKTVAAMDLLAPGIGEIIGGSQREERLDVLEARIKEMGLNLEDYWWYLELRKFGGAPHAGFGLGFERMLMYVTGMENIRDVIPFPRTPKNAEF